MRIHILRLVPVLFAALVLGCYTPRPITSYQNWADRQAEELRRAGERLGIPIDTNTVNFSAGNGSFSTATARNWRTTPPTELSRGVDFAVAWLASADQGFPAGFYALRAVADVRDVGRTTGRIQVLNEARSVVTEVPATVDVFSLRVPPGAERIAPAIFAEVVRPPEGTRTCKSSSGQTCWCCENGALICTDRLWRWRFADTVATNIIR